MPINRSIYQFPWIPIVCTVAIALSGLFPAELHAQSIWKRAQVPEGITILDVDIPAEGSAVGVGRNGRIVRSTDNGATWSVVPSALPEQAEIDLAGISFGTPTVGIATGSGATIVKTSDGGRTWTKLDAGDYGEFGFPFGKPFMLGPDFAIVAGRAFFCTTDGGTTWIGYPSIGDNIVDIWMFDTVNGFAVGTTDADGQARIVSTRNGGRGWEETDFMMWNGYLSALCFGDSRHGYAVGARGTIGRTSDGGTNWSEATSGTTVMLWDVAFRDAFNGIAVGDSGVILSTSDGGATWATEASGTTARLTGVTYKGSTAIVVGAGNEGGVVLYATVPGSSIRDRSGIASQRSLAIHRSNSVEAITIQCTLQRRARTRLELLDLLGRNLRTIKNEVLEQGNHTIHLDLENLPAGTYFVRMINNDRIESCLVTR